MKWWSDISVSACLLQSWVWFCLIITEAIALEYISTDPYTQLHNYRPYRAYYRVIRIRINLNSDLLTSHILIRYQKFPSHGWLTSTSFVFSIFIAFLIVSRDEDPLIYEVSPNDINTPSLRRAIPGDATDWYTVDIILVYPTEYFIGWGHQHLT